MDAESLRLDPIGTILEHDGDSAKIVADPINGYDRIIPAADLLDDMGNLFAREIEDTDQGYEAIWQKLLEDEKAYEAITEPGEVPKIPLVKRIINQQHAWTTTAIISKNPIISVKPLDGGSYTIPAQLLSDPQSANQPGAMYQTEELSAGDAANLYEQFLQYKLTERLPFEALVEDTVMSVHVGEAPTWWKVYYDPKTRTAKKRQFADTEPGSKTKKYTGVVDVTVADGEMVRLAHVSNRNITIPLDGGDDEQATPWLAERTPLTNSDIWEGVKAKRYDFCLDAEGEVDPNLVRGILGFADDPMMTTTEAQVAMIDLRVAKQPTLKHDVRTVYFFWPIKTTKTTKIQTDGSPNADGTPAMMDDKQEVIEIRSLCGTLHVKSRRFLNLYANPYWHGKRPYVPFFMRKRPHRFSGNTSAGDLAPIASLISSIFQLEIQNGVQQNVKVFLIRNNSVTWNFLSRQGNVLKPGLKIPFEDEKDVLPVQLGSPIESMAAEISFLNTEGERLGVVNDYDLGADIPNRTAAATVGQIQQMAKMQPQTILRSIRRSISKAIEMYLSTVSQYHVFETIPFLDEKTNKLIQMLISFPQDAIENHFSFHVTATGDEDTSQGRIEKAQLMLDATDKANEAAMKLSDIILDPSTPPPASEFALHLLLRREEIYGELLQVQGPQYGKHKLTEKKIRDLQQQAQAYAQQKAAEAAQNPPQQQKPNVSIALKGELPPDQEAQIIQQTMGITTQPQGAPNGQDQLPSPASGGNVPQALPGAPGPGGVQPQPSDAGIPQPSPPGPVQPGGAPVIGQ